MIFRFNNMIAKPNLCCFLLLSGSIRLLL
uniref:Uncharacterized protein n=1 Tax=Anguilla anguilla TaxID=7936 RepID=A0A0E9UD65_ANGAN